MSYISYLNYIKKSLVIHEGNTKQISTMTSERILINNFK